MQSHLNHEQAEEAKIQLNDILNSLGETDEFSSFNQIASLLALPEDQFGLLSEHFLFEIEKELNDPNQELFLVQSLNSTGTKVEDLLSSYEGLIEEIDGQMAELLSAQKRTFLKRLIFLVINAISRTEGISKRIMIIPTECSNGADLPTYAHLSDAGADLVALEDVTLAPGEQKIIPTGIKVAIPLGYALLIQPRSGLSSKTKLRIANTPGLIDSGYRGEIGVIMENIEPPIKAIHPRSTILSHQEDTIVPQQDVIRQEPIVAGDIEFGKSYTITKGQKFAQMRLVEVPRASYYSVDDINTIDSDRGASGFGSTDLNNAEIVDALLAEETEETKVIENVEDKFTVTGNGENNN